MMWKISRKAPSKINLYLKVTRRREDGYHELKSLFLPLDCPGDTITISSSGGGIELSSSLPELPCDSRNICRRAAEAYAAAARLAPEWNIHIEKHIPVAAGLGGGSSDAAAVFGILQQQYNALAPDALRAVALAAGADVPFFLSPEPAAVTGIGECITPVSIGGAIPPLLIAAPRFPVSAAWSYRNLAPERVSPDDEIRFGRLLEALRAADWETCGKLIYNDLGFAVFRKFPLTRILREAMLDAGACGVEISGSGPVLFAIFASPGNAASAACKIAEKFPEVEIFLPSQA